MNKKRREITMIRFPVKNLINRTAHCRDVVTTFKPGSFRDIFFKYNFST